METIKEEYKPCRFCGGLTDLLVPIYADEGLKLELETKISRHLPIHVEPTDGIINTVCYPCVERLLNWDQFVTMCVDMDAKLRLYQSHDALYRVDMELIEMDTHEDPVFSESDEEPLITKKQKLDEEIKKKEMLKCETCGKKFKTQKWLTSHKQVCQFGKYRCDICGTQYKKRINLNRHKAKEHVTSQTKCKICPMSVSDSKMARHMSAVHSIKVPGSVKCKYCELCFKNKYLRSEHVKQVHINEEIKCETCEFTGPRYLVKRHSRNAHTEKRYPCSLCTNAFQTLHLLKMHMTSHSDLRSYTCDVCGMSFKRLNNVRDHMKCHQQKSNQCQICGNFFARKRYLAIHEKTIHNFYADGSVPDEKGFECGTCGAKLKWKKNLLAHMRIHTGEKPYVCKICNQGFVCHGSLRTHMVKHGHANSQDSTHQTPFQIQGILNFNPSYLSH